MLHKDKEILLVNPKSEEIETIYIKSNVSNKSFDVFIGYCLVQLSQ